MATYDAGAQQPIIPQSIIGKIESAVEEKQTEIEESQQTEGVNPFNAENFDPSPTSEKEVKKLEDDYTALLDAVNNTQEPKSLLDTARDLLDKMGIGNIFNITNNVNNSTNIEGDGNTIGDNNANNVAKDSTQNVATDNATVADNGSNVAQDSKLNVATTPTTTTTSEIVSNDDDKSIVAGTVEYISPIATTSEVDSSKYDNMELPELKTLLSEKEAELAKLPETLATEQENKLTEMQNKKQALDEVQEKNQNEDVSKLQEIDNELDGGLNGQIISLDSSIEEKNQQLQQAKPEDQAAIQSELNQLETQRKELWDHKMELENERDGIIKKFENDNSEIGQAVNNYNKARNEFGTAEQSLREYNQKGSNSRSEALKQEITEIKAAIDKKESSTAY